MSSYFQKFVSVCILMYWTVHKKTRCFYSIYKMPVVSFTMFIAFIFGYEINRLIFSTAIICSFTFYKKFKKYKFCLHFIQLLY